MPGILTKTDLSFDDIHIDRRLDPLTEKYIWWVACGYTVHTAEGETFQRDKQIVLSPAQVTKVKTFFADIKNQIKAEEGIP